MIKPAFSTVACPEWTLTEVAQHAQDFGFEAVELRTFGVASRRFACDPALTSPEKIRRLFGSRGVEVLSLATSCRFDDPINPPVIGLVIGDNHKTVREARRCIDIAVAIECPFVRVFAFELPPREKREMACRRVASRLKDACDHADKTGTKVVIENGGSFPTAADIAELVQRVNHPLLGVCYALAAGQMYGGAADDPAAVVKTLGNRLWSARIKDVNAQGHPVPLGNGILKGRDFVAALSQAKFDGPLIYEWDRAWLPDVAPADRILPAAAATLSEWIIAASPQHAESGGARRPAQRLHEHRRS